MATTFLTANGTVKLPASIQKKLGLKAGDRIELLPFEAGQVLMIAKNQSITSLKGILPKPEVDCAVDEMVEMAVKRVLAASK